MKTKEKVYMAPHLVAIERVKVVRTFLFVYFVLQLSEFLVPYCARNRTEKGGWKPRSKRHGLLQAGPAVTPASSPPAGGLAAVGGMVGAPGVAPGQTPVNRPTGRIHMDGRDHDRG